MTAPAAPPTFVDGQVLASADLASLSSTLNSLYQLTQGGFRNAKPMLIVTRELSQWPCPPNLSVLMEWDTIRVNSDSMASLTIPNSVQVNTSGWYRLSFQAHWDTLAGGTRTCRILVNSTDPSAAVASDSRPPAGAEGTVTACSAVVAVYAGSQVSGNLYQSGAANSYMITGYSGCVMIVEWLGPL